ncbi:MAG TPA: phasin family protein [Usitatibacter sp.]|nr:phasin family protein [Usitatibacter sp.]
MARKKSKSRSRSQDSSSDAAQSARDSAQKIWLAGLGAFERAKTEGPRMFETLVEQGRNMGARAVGAADEALKSLRQANYEGGGRWDKLEQVFEERVSKSLNRLGVLTRAEVGDLSRQVQELNETVRNLMESAGKSGSGGKRASGKRTARKAAGAKAPRAGKAAAAKRAPKRASRARQA